MCSSDLEVPRLGDSPELLSQLANATPGYVVPTSLLLKGTRFVVVVQSRIEPSEADYAKDRPLVENGLLMQRRQEFASQWQTDLVAQAKVVRN
mgnify:FL=1